MDLDFLIYEYLRIFFLPSVVEDDDEVEVLIPLFVDEARLEPFLLGILWGFIVLKHFNYFEWISHFICFRKIGSITLPIVAW